MRTTNKRPVQSKKVFSFVVDGECEFWYLQMMKDNEKPLNIHISPEIYKKKTLDEQYKRVVELKEISAKVFWIVDFDVVNKETQEGIRGQKSKLTKFKELYQKIKCYPNIEIIVNNPCFEFWILLHFANTTRFYESYKKLLPHLQKYLSDYEKTEKYYIQSNPDIYKRLRRDLKTAIGNAEKQGDFDFENCKTKGVAEMHKFFNDAGIKEIIKAL
ncbi:hypothetical protein FACS1894182_04490 [Bacteroidia bacterium]|nr:hypothetical protein FACS1894182_04490 [Bacteroidia bacterium]